MNEFLKPEPINLVVKNDSLTNNSYYLLIACSAREHIFSPHWYPRAFLSLFSFTDKETKVQRSSAARIQAASRKSVVEPTFKARFI